MTTVNPETVYHRDQSFVYRNIAGEAILVPIRHHVADLESIYVLNPLATFIWDRLDGRHTVRQIKQSILQEFEVSDQVGEADLVDFLQQLTSIGAIQER